MLVHLDTDIGGDPDDVCALAMLLGWPDVEITGITTTHEEHGRRAGFVHEVLRLAECPGVPVAAGAEHSMATLTQPGGFPDDERYWGHAIASADSPAGAALDLLEGSIELGATVIAIGPFTNLGLFEVARPGMLDTVPVVVMGGGYRVPDPGYPQWPKSYDWNVQCDTRAAEIVNGVAQLTIVPLAATVKVHLRGAHLPRLRACGAIGDLMARQAEACAVDRRAGLADRHSKLPADLLNFHHDPLACAVAVGWDGVTFDGNVVADVDGDAFSERWLQAIEHLHSGS
ncbi:MAG TPA: nucleoside hydrolase [Acidimicrobiales bacterium]|nr:nucleoside hydrolase [Acidimicrobiales bacterium]